MQVAMRLNPSEQNVYALTLELLRHWTWQPAIEIATYGVKNFPDSRRLQLAQAIAFYGSKDYVDAAAAFSALLSLDPENNSYGDLLGKSCSALGWSGAPQCDTMADFADKHPANAQVAVYAASNILHNADPDAKKKLDQAQQLLEQAIRVDPKIAQAYCELGTLQQERLQWRQSTVNLNKAIELRPAFPAAHYRLARAYAHLHQPELADKERALLLKYDQQVQDDSKAIIKEVTMFLVASH
jgi:tetratricopeptide (TPR) repeat protein